MRCATPQTLSKPGQISARPSAACMHQDAELEAGAAAAAPTCKTLSSMGRPWQSQPGTNLALRPCRQQGGRCSGRPANLEPAAGQPACIDTFATPQPGKPSPAQLLPCPAPAHEQGSDPLQAAVCSSSAPTAQQALPLSAQQQYPDRAHLQQLVAIDDVLQDLVERVANVQVAVGIGRAVVQREGGLQRGQGKGAAARQRKSGSTWCGARGSGVQGPRRRPCLRRFLELAVNGTQWSPRHVCLHNEPASGAAVCPEVSPARLRRSVSAQPKWPSRLTSRALFQTSLCGCKGPGNKSTVRAAHRPKQA